MKSICYMLVFLPLLLAGCLSSGKDASLTSDMSNHRYAIPDMSLKKMTPPEGTIFNVDDAKDLYEDKRARRVGDIVLVKIVETSSGTKKAETITERESTVTGGISSLFGIEQWYSNKNPYFNPSSTSLDATLTNDFEVTGETKRNSSVTATISARVVDVTIDGNLVVRGYREVRVNNETQHIILSGIIRSQDISSDNSVLSSNIADARIEYSGTGTLGDKQQPGWLASILDVIWPF